MRRCVLVVLLAGAAACGSPETAQQAAPLELPPTAFDGALVTNAAARIAHGERITYVLGCKGCHGKQLQGKRFYELYGSNLTRDVANYDDAQLERLLRDGERIDRRDLWGMPSEIFQHLSEPDMAALIAYLRTLTPAGPPTQPPLPFEAETRKLIAQGKIMPAAQWVKKAKATTPAELGPQHALGRYITMVTCAECHGPGLEGGDGTPGLITAAAYSRAEFETLITRGVPTGGRKLGPLMTNVAQNRFSKLTQAERDALYAYLKALADRPQ